MVDCNSRRLIFHCLPGILSESTRNDICRRHPIIIYSLESLHIFYLLLNFLNIFIFVIFNQDNNEALERSLDDVSIISMSDEDASPPKLSKMEIDVGDQVEANKDNVKKC